LRIAALRSSVVGLVKNGHPVPEILAAYPYLEEADIQEALAFAQA